MQEINPLIYVQFCVEDFNRKEYIKNLENIKAKFKDNKFIFNKILDTLKRQQKAIYINYNYFRNKRCFSNMWFFEKKSLRHLKQMRKIVQHYLKNI